MALKIVGSSPITHPMKKALAKASAFFNEINPCGICEMPFGCEIWLRHVKYAAARDGICFISLDAAASNLTRSQILISHPKDISLHNPISAKCAL